MVIVSNWTKFNQTAASNGLLNNLDAHYAFENNANDSTWSFNGTATNMVYVSSGQFLGSYSADFVATWTYDASLWWQWWWYINTGYTFGSSTYSILMTVKPDTTNNVQTYLSNDSWWFDNSLQAWVCVEWTWVSTTNRFVVVHQNWANSTRYVVEDSADISTSNWTQYLYTYDWTTQRLYRNWTLVDSTVKSWLTLNARAFYLGRRHWTAIRYWNGLWDETVFRDGIVLDGTDASTLWNSWSWLPYSSYTL